MGRQSSRIYMTGSDHKDVYFQGSYHNKMYIGSELVWEKLKGSENIQWRTIYWSNFSFFDPHNHVHDSKTYQHEWVGNICGVPTVVSWLQRDESPHIVKWGYMGVFSVNDDGKVYGKYLRSGSRLDRGNAFYISSKSSGSPPVINNFWVSSTGGAILSGWVVNNEFGDTVFCGDALHFVNITAANLEIPWHMYILDGVVKISSELRQEDGFNVYIDTHITIDGELTAPSWENLGYFSDTHGTILSCDERLYFTRNGIDWSTIYQGIPDFTHQRAAYFAGEYIIVSPELGKGIGSNGNEYTLPNKGVAYIFVKDDFLYMSCDDGMLYKTSDMEKYIGKNIGRSVFGARKNKFYSRRSEDITWSGGDAKVPIMDEAKIDF